MLSIYFSYYLPVNNNPICAIIAEPKYVPINTHDPTIIILQDTLFKSPSLLAIDNPANVKIGVVIPKKSTAWIASIAKGNIKQQINDVTETQPNTGKSFNILTGCFCIDFWIKTPTIVINPSINSPKKVSFVTGVDGLWLFAVLIYFTNCVNKIKDKLNNNIPNICKFSNILFFDIIYHLSLIFYT